jgi:histidyl-tRNA synthetase
MYDILPERWRLFAHVMGAFTRVAEDAGFGRIVTPVLEDEALFARTIGEGTDVMDKEIYAF